MKISTIEISGFIGCFESLRIPFKKEARSNLDFHIMDWNSGNNLKYESILKIDANDIKLLQSLITKGDEHSKSARLINVTAKIKAPLYLWSEMDTYFVGVNRGCSESTMHTISKTGVKLCDFEIQERALQSVFTAISDINTVVKNDSISNTDKIRIIKHALPSGYLQERILNFNYQALRRICAQRDGHRLTQWRVFIDWVKTLPYANELIFI